VRPAWESPDDWCAIQCKFHGLVADGDAAGGEHLLDMRRLSGKRKYSQTEWLMISGGNRQPV